MLIVFKGNQIMKRQLVIDALLEIIAELESDIHAPLNNSVNLEELLQTIYNILQLN